MFSPRKSFFINPFLSPGGEPRRRVLHSVCLVPMESTSSVGQRWHLTEKESVRESVPLPEFTLIPFRWSYLFAQYT